MARLGRAGFAEVLISALAERECVRERYWLAETHCGSWRETLHTRPKGAGSGRLVEEVLVNLFDVQGILDAAPDIVTDHKLRELLTVDQNNPLAKKLRRLARGRGKG